MLEDFLCECDIAGCQKGYLILVKEQIVQNRLLNLYFQFIIPNTLGSKAPHGKCILRTKHPLLTNYLIKRLAQVLSTLRIHRATLIVFNELQRVRHLLADQSEEIGEFGLIIMVVKRKGDQS